MTCLAIDHDFTSKILNLKLPIPENNGTLKRLRMSFPIHQNSFLQHAAKHLDEQQLLPSSCLFRHVLFNFGLNKLK